MDYAGWITAVTSLLEYQVGDATSATPTNVDAFNAILPAAIDYTENRLQRDLDLIATTVTSIGKMTANKRLVALPSVNIPAPIQVPQLIGTPIAPGSVISTVAGSDTATVNWPGFALTAWQDVSILNPLKVGGLTLGGVYQIISVIDANNFTINTTFLATSTDSQTVIGNGIYIVMTQIRLIGQPPLEPVTRDYLDYAWPSDQSYGAGIFPVQWCPNDQSNILVGPAPDQAYPFEAVGTMRIPQLSYANPSNFLTAQLPDLYVQCSMIFFQMYQGNMGAASDDPAKTQSYENQYQILLAGAKGEEIRKNYANLFPSPSNPSTLKGT